MPTRNPLRRWALAAFLAPWAIATAPPAGADDELDDILGGFDDSAETDSDLDSDFDAGGRFWELTGNVSLGASINYLDHESDTGTDYQGLSRLRSRLNLQLDLDLPRGWKGRLAGFGFYDWAYLIRGRHDFTDEVLDDYEWEVDFQEVWVEGSVASQVDLKVGRQIVNWGRSDTLRVLDILNPLDNREPGLVDIEDLRRPVMMLKASTYWGNWSFTAIAIPEIRFSKIPPIGSDFAPSNSSLGELAFFVAPEHIPSESFDNTGWAAAVTGIFSGWDISFHFARVWADRAYLVGRFTPDPDPAVAFAGTELRHSRITLLGAGANYTYGSFLFKTEIAWLDGVDYATSTPLLLPIVGTVDIPMGSVRRSRLDFMAGTEYYGFTDTNVALEVANRHIFGYRESMRPNFDVEENALETALRITRTFLNERLDVTLVAIAFGNHAQDGSVVRLEAGYDLRDALVLKGGILLFQKGDNIPFDSISRNDRLFVELKYSF
jgi:hypothetical protein